MAEAFERAAVRTARSWGAWVRRRTHTTADELVDDEENILVKGTNGQWQWKKGHAREKRELTDAATKVQLAHTRLQLSLRE